MNAEGQVFTEQIWSNPLMILRITDGRPGMSGEGWSSDEVPVHLRFLHRACLLLDSSGVDLLREKIFLFSLPLGFDPVRRLHRPLRRHPLHQSLDRLLAFRNA